MNMTHQIDATAQILASMTRQTELLQALLNHLQQPQLGFTDAAGAVRIYCNRQHGSLWYRLDRENNPIAIPHQALTGYIAGLEFPRVERRGKETIKLQCTIRADRTYILEAGYDSHFSKGLLMAIASLSPEHIQHPISIAPQPGQDESVLFCQVYCDDELVIAPYSDKTDWREIARRAIALVKAL